MSRILITSALPYINGIKHLGNLVGSMLPADIYGRFERQRGREVLLICATDEHGTPAELAAAEAGLEVEEFCRQQHEAQAGVGRRFGLSWDYFGRSSSPQNAELTRHFAARLEANDLIEERLTQQVYSIDDSRFLPDRYIVGTCPHCGYEMARGDQCENCTRVLDPTDLLEPRSAVSGSENLEVRESRHLFLRQSQMVDRLRQWIDSHADWPPLVSSIARKWLDEGLHDRCITRDLSWGISIDREGFDEKVFYVWFDAPIEYIGATREWAEDEASSGRDWRSWWYEADDVRYVQFMAKDNVPFHTVGFPVTLMGSAEPWKLVDYIKGFNWLTYYGGKFSTSQKRGVFMDQALELLPADYWRYYLIANAPESGDSSFTWETFQTTVNKDLADVFGNFVNRTLKFCAARFGTEVPVGGEPGEAELALEKALQAGIDAYTAELETMQFRKAMRELRALWALGNDYFQRSEPWAVIKEDPERAAMILRTTLQLVRLFARLSWPIVPHSAELLLGALSQAPEGPPSWPTSAAEELRALPPGHAFEVPGVLFQKLTDEQVVEWSEQFAPRGRGADHNPHNRFDRIQVDFDGPTGSRATEYLTDSSRSIIAGNQSPDVPFDASINPYRGCEHGCSYCYARPSHEFLGFSAGLDFESKILVKQDAAELLRRELAAPSWRPQVLV
nr:methionine--tRNA ligase-like [Nerophis lumbriciformis]